MRKGRAARPLPVCNCEDGLVLKFLPDGLLQEFVRLLVHTGRGLINTQELHGDSRRFLCLKMSVFLTSLVFICFHILPGR